MNRSKIAALTLSAGFAAATLATPDAKAAVYQYIWICNSADSTHHDSIQVVRNGVYGRHLFRTMCDYAYNGDEALRVRMNGSADWKRKYDWGGGDVASYSQCYDGPATHNPDNRAFRVYYKRISDLTC